MGFLFQSTLPVGGATFWDEHLFCLLRISIHAPRGGSDTLTFLCEKGNSNFNPRSPWGERLPGDQDLDPRKVISIHAPRGGSDQCDHFQARGCHDFNPRSPWGERLYPYVFDPLYPIISIHAPRGGSDLSPCLAESVMGISIHAPRGGSDPKLTDQALMCMISIHAPRGGSDWQCRHLQTLRENFNPRSPWGERPWYFSQFTTVIMISIHAPRGGSDAPSNILSV